MDSKKLIIQNALTQLNHRVNSSPLSGTAKVSVVERVVSIDTQLLLRLCSESTRPLTIPIYCISFVFSQVWILKLLR